MKKDADDAETALISSSEKVILDLLERDIAGQPERLQPVTADQVVTPALSRQRTGESTDRCQPGQTVDGLGRHRPSIRAGEEAQGQSGVRHRHSLHLSIGEVGN
ncbi:hypothetical protein [Hydrogenophaga sp.]|uniref:hypothetical protein n=1 Tax=Hydrogenophaga sp. TaxID=1904254 RepID=UPI002AB8666B|nr:hypothetical protein [Hydrogenophaga sp.]MDZ4396099.1 hypothetical protein [Hydrogenophaga sp.]